MPARDFKDGRGREWRVWDVNPDDLNPRTKDEVYLAQLYYTGWLVFESAAGGDKRRLHPIPKGWQELPDSELEALLHKAEVIAPRKSRGDKLAITDTHATPAEGTPEFDVTDLSVVRTFRYPSGRYWTVCVIQHPENGGPPVLQFTAGARHFDLENWPKDWADYADEDLINLLRGAAPRPKGQTHTPGAPHRRWDDRPSY